MLLTVPQFILICLCLCALSAGGTYFVMSLYTRQLLKWYEDATFAARGEQCNAQRQLPERFGLVCFSALVWASCATKY